MVRCWDLCVCVCVCVFVCFSALLCFAVRSVYGWFIWVGIFGGRGGREGFVLMPLLLLLSSGEWVSG